MAPIRTMISSVLLLSLALAAFAGSQCADRVTWCTSWANQGYCAPKWLYDGQSVRDYQCQKACGTCTTPSPSPTGTGDAMLAAVNAERKKVGAGPLRIDDRLMQAAKEQSDYQLEIQTMTHGGRNGASLGDRISAEGFEWRAVAENVAWGQQDVASVMQSWMNSPGHRANLLNKVYTSFGWARAGSYWTQDFAA